jgi:hypothetical protein
MSAPERRNNGQQRRGKMFSRALTIEHLACCWMFLKLHSSYAAIFNLFS